MLVRLPPFLYEVYTTACLREAELWRGVRRARIDQRLLDRMALAIDSGLSRIERCSPDEYAGPHPELVARAERERGTLMEVPGHRNGAPPHSLAWQIVGAAAELHPELLWLEIGCFLPACQNDACEAEFAPLVQADPANVLWLVAGSLHTWAQSGVWTPPILKDTLSRWRPAMPRLEPWIREHQDDRDAYVRFMSRHAARLLDGGVEAPSGPLLDNYFELLAAQSKAGY
ncbi:MAG: hypothetical protein U0271_38865 [Polyangiaceae bacterium]